MTSPYFTLTRSPLASVQWNFGVLPPVGSRANGQSTSAFASNAPGPGGLTLKSTEPGGTRGGDHTRAAATAAFRGAAVARAGCARPGGSLRAINAPPRLP